MTPLCIQSQRPWRKGWQLVCWTGVPVVARMCAKTRRERRVCRELAQVAVVPGRLGAAEDARRLPDAVPADPETVAVDRLHAEPGVLALDHQGVLRLEQEVLQQHR